MEVVHKKEFVYGEELRRGNLVMDRLELGRKTGSEVFIAGFWLGMIWKNKFMSCRFWWVCELMKDGRLSLYISKEKTLF